MSKLARRHRRRKFKKNPAPTRNPPITRDLIEWVAPGFGGFAATRLLTRGAQMVIAKRWPKASKHAGAAASIGSFLASWFLGSKWKWLERYHTPVTVGAAIAAGQSLLQIYAPNKLGWIVSDASSQVATQVAAPAQQQALPSNLEEINDDPSWYTYNDAYDKGRYGSLGGGNLQQQSIQAPKDDVVPIDEQQPGDEEMAAGIFGN